MPTVTRTKYLFKDRAEAEEHYRSADASRNLYRLGLSLAMHDKRYGHYKGSKDYSIDVYGALRADDAVVLLTFAPKGQKPSTEVFYLEAFNRMAAESCYYGGDYGHTLARLAQAARECVHEARRADGWFGAVEQV